MQFPTTLESWLTCTAIIIGGAWALFRFGLFRERHAKIEFNLDCRYIETVNDHHVIELAAVMENKGLVRHKIDTDAFAFWLFIFKSGSKIDLSEAKINWQVKLDRKIKKRNWLPTDDEYTFIDGGVIQRYTHLTAVPINTEFLSLYSEFEYPKTAFENPYTEEDFHSAQKVFSINELLSSRNKK